MNLLRIVANVAPPPGPAARNSGQHIFRTGSMANAGIISVANTVAKLFSP